MRSPEERGIHREMIALMHDGILLHGGNKCELVADLKTFSRRFSNEGFSFLSKTLPALGKAIDTALSGNVTFCCPTSFKKRKNSAFPKFLGFALRCIFDENGYLQKQVDPNLVRWIRTFCMYAYKIEVPFCEDETYEFGLSFIEVDEEIKNLQVDSIPDSMRNIMRNHLHHILKGYVRGKFADGPGSSSDSPRNAKRAKLCPPSKVRNHFGRDAFLQPMEQRTAPGEFFVGKSPDYSLDSLYLYLQAIGSCLVGADDTQPYAFDSDLVSKVIFVPKDSRGPRTIACEPVHHMFAQQAVRNGVYDAVESSPLTRGRVNFLDQSVNQRLTFDSGNATLDLKEASDRVSYALVKDLFPPTLFADMDACRTETAKLPNGRLIELAKFAPMGNALCFPTMALLAYTSVCSAIYQAGGVLPSKQDRVFVYGDDIIVPNEWATVAIEGLETVGLLVNKNKSFVNSRFRESCGQDTLDESTVTPLRRRKLPGGGSSLVKGGSALGNNFGAYYVHSTAVLNSAWELGYYSLAVAIEKELFEHTGRKLPYGTAESSYACIICEDTDEAWELNEKCGFDRRGKLRAYVFRDGKEKNLHSSYSRLRSSFNSKVCPITGDNTPGWLTIGQRQPVLQTRYLKRWYVGAYV